jgi:glycosyltransferase involved in cell wall biosynthesis
VPAALVISQSPLARDPRVRRQVSWLVEEGWEVDTLGLGALELPGMRDHFALGPPSPVVRPVIAKALLHTLLPYRARFRLLSGTRIPREVVARLRAGAYDAVVFNDIHLIPWIAVERAFAPGHRFHLHFDLHEYHPPHLPPTSLGNRMVDRYHGWGRAMLASRAIDSRSAVARGIAELYERELEVADWHIIRNAPDEVSLSPSPVDRGRIRLIHHGVAGAQRGLRDIISAVRQLGPQFDLTFMLIGEPAAIESLRLDGADLGDRLQFLPPVPTAEIAHAINPFDVEVMFFPPVTRNLEFVLPNKLFEAVQGRLALAIGPSPMMAELVDQYGNGVVAAGWTPEDLAAALRSLTTPDVAAMKEASHRAASELNAAREKDAFLAALGIASTEEKP